MGEPGGTGTRRFCDTPTRGWLAIEGDAPACQTKCGPVWRILSYDESVALGEVLKRPSRSVTLVYRGAVRRIPNRRARQAALASVLVPVTVPPFSPCTQSTAWYSAPCDLRLATVDALPLHAQWAGSVSVTIVPEERDDEEGERAPCPCPSGQPGRHGSIACRMLYPPAGFHTPIVPRSDKVVYFWAARSGLWTSTKPDELSISCRRHQRPAITEKWRKTEDRSRRLMKLHQCQRVAIVPMQCIYNYFCLGTGPLCRPVRVDTEQVRHASARAQTLFHEPLCTARRGCALRPFFTL
jgi:hypothetical protein